MRYRKLGRTGVDVGIVGLGAEHLEFASREVVTSVVDEALDGGVNYIDLFMASPGVRDNFGVVLKNKRHQVMIAGHLGAVLENGQCCKSRDKARCEKYFDDLLIRLQTDYLDTLMLHYVDDPDSYSKVFDSAGLLAVAVRLKEEGKARFIGMSGHNVQMALQAVNSGYIDVLMFPVNPAFDTLPGDLTTEALKNEESYNYVDTTTSKSVTEREALYHDCAVHNVGIVAMKPYAAGILFQPGNPSSIVLTPVQCLSYALSRPGVCTVVPGCRTAAEMKAALAFLKATDEEKDYSAIQRNPMWKLKSSCMYCNHCLPCPVNIDIGATTRLADAVGYGGSDNISREYEVLSVKASACTECGVCVERCPFDVDVIANISRAVAVFEK